MASPTYVEIDMANITLQDSLYNDESTLAEALHTPGLGGIMFDTGELDPTLPMGRSTSSHSLGLPRRSCSSGAPLRRVVSVHRPVCTQREFDDRYVARKRGNSGKCSPRKCCLRYSRSTWQRVSSVHFWRRTALKYLPCIDMIKSYQVKECLLSDLIAGLTVGVMHMPQGMAYAQLATLPPVNGLYTSLFPVLFYCIFGTSRQVSMGTIAIVSLLTGTFLESAVPVPEGGYAYNQSNPGNETDPYIQSKIWYACSMTLAVGLIQLLMGILQLGFLTRYLSDPLISGFTVGAAVHVFTSQLKTVFGVKIKRHHGAFTIPLTFYEIARSLPTTNVPTVCLSIVCIVILVIFKEVINPRVKDKIKAPIPIELVIVICGTVVSSLMDLKGGYDVKIVGYIPRGIPAPVLPNLSLAGSHIGDCFSTAVIAFSVCISLSKLFAKKHDYTVDSNQELFAYGLMNCLSSFFSCYPSASSLSRSAVQESMGGKTQVAGLISCSLLLLVLLLVGPLFETVPNCCLSAIILVALKGMFTQVEELPLLWRLCKWDFATWIIAALSTVLLDVGYGLLIGILFSVFSVVFRTQSPSAHLLGRIRDTDIYKNLDAYTEINDIPGVKIFRYEGSLYFACYEHFRDTLYKKVGYHPQQIIIERKNLQRKIKNLQKKTKATLQEAGGTSNTLNSRADVPMNDRGGGDLLGQEQQLTAKLVNYQSRLANLMQFDVHHVVIDASTWGYLDHVGVLVLTQVIQEYNAIGISVFLANPKTDIRDMLDRSNFYEKNDPNLIYVTVHDAVMEAQFEHETSLRMARHDEERQHNDNQREKLEGTESNSSIFNVHLSGDGIQFQPSPLDATNETQADQQVAEAKC